MTANDKKKLQQLLQQLLQLEWVRTTHRAVTIVLAGSDTTSSTVAAVTAKCPVWTAHWNTIQTIY